MYKVLNLRKTVCRFSTSQVLPCGDLHLLYLTCLIVPKGSQYQARDLKMKVEEGQRKSNVILQHGDNPGDPKKVLLFDQA